MKLPPQKKESGAALAVALILVLVSTLLSITVMETGEIDARISNNEQHQEAAFRATETASSDLMTDSNLTTMISAGDTSMTSTDSINSNVEITAELSLVGITVVRNSSINLVQNYQFMARAEGSIPGVGTRRIVTLGGSRAAPKN